LIHGGLAVGMQVSPRDPPMFRIIADGKLEFRPSFRAPRSTRVKQR